MRPETSPIRAPDVQVHGGIADDETRAIATPGAEWEPPSNGGVAVLGDPQDRSSAAPVARTKGVGARAGVSLRVPAFFSACYSAQPHREKHGHPPSSRGLYGWLMPPAWCSSRWNAMNS